MQIQTDISLKEYLEFNWYFHRRLGTTRVLRWLVLIPGGLLTFLCLFGIARSHDPLQTALALKPLLTGVMIPFFAYLFFYKYFIFLLLKLNLREGKNKDVFGPNQITLTPEGIAETSSTRSISTTWPSVEKIVDLPDIVYIYVSTLGAHIIPRRSFASDADFKAFVDQAKSYLAQANGQ